MVIGLAEIVLACGRNEEEGSEIRERRSAGNSMG
jgi:hypothetical protein